MSWKNIPFKVSTNIRRSNRIPDTDAIPFRVADSFGVFRGITDDFDSGESFRPRCPGGTARRCAKPCRATSSALAIPTNSASFIGGVGHHDSDPGLGADVCDSPQGRTYSKLRCNA